MKRSQHITTAGLPLGTALFFLTFGASLASPASPTKVSPGTASTAKANPDAPKTAEPASSDSTTLRGGEGGTKFPDMTVTGEDRIRIDFERPELILDLDPKSAPGLERERTLDIVDRGAPDLNDPLLAQSAGQHSAFTGRPWLTMFSTGPVARFRPSLSKVQRWTLTVADSRGATVARFTGQGRVPDQITWDGRTLGGDLALPGLTYSYVFEAFDEAGNKRNFLGDAFTVKPYIREEKTGLTLLVPGTELAGKTPAGTPSPILMETASWLNQLERVDTPIVVEAQARTRDEAVALAARVTDALPALLLGPKNRLEVRQNVVPDAPEIGVCIVKASS
jgi:hypothetical protein